MQLSEKIQREIHIALKNRNQIKVVTLRSALSKLKDRQIEKQEKLEESEELKVIQMLVKQHKESITMFKDGGRDDLVEKEKAELKILEKYLPSMMSENEVKLLINDIIKEVGAESLSDIGKVMQNVMQRGSGRVDGKLAQQILRGLLS
ncbi:GatB/YqeY domain-containing protein [Candidatus Neomarinimicrobiota bacterium]